MKKTTLFIVLLVALVLFLPISNLLGLTSKNEPIPSITGSSPNFVQVSDIFQNKCVDCHSPGMMRKPIYSELPIAKQIMAKDVENASARMSLSKQLYSGETPFSPLMLARLEGVIRHNSMPPALYLTMHWTDILTDEEKGIILAWIAEERAKSSWNADSAQAQKGEPVQPLPLTVDLDLKKVELGHQLFFDRSLSGDDTLNCASCHNLAKGGTDQSKVATGIRGQQGPINSPTVYNAMYNIAQFWDGRAKDLHEQAAGPVANPIEMGAKWDDVVEKLKQADAYQAAFNELYPEQGLTKDTVIDAIVNFEQSLVTSNSRFDQYLRGNNDILTVSEKQGYELFKDNCASCHFGPVLGGLSFEKMGVKHDYFKLRGGQLTEVDNGRFNVTKQEKDRQFFKVPTLRNVQLTQPYFHDGSVASLEEAVRVMAKVQQDKNLSPDEINKIIAFLKTLTGEYKGKLITQLKDEDL
jgi:cytochrome c peroxidase